MTQYLSKDYLRAIIYKKMNQDDRSNILFKQALADVEKQLNNIGDDPRFLAAKGKILAYLGENENAIKYGKMATDMVSVVNDKFQGVDYNYDLAKIYSICGEFKKAVEEIKKIQNVQPNMAIVGFLTNDAEFSNIQKYPGFRRLINDYKEEQGI